jgi:hypothetical protein
MRTRSFDRKFIWPKALSENDHLTESLFQKMVIWPKDFFEKWLFDRKVVWPIVFFFEKLSFSNNFHLTDCSYFIRIVHVFNFFVAARHSERKKLFLYCHHYYFNRVENVIKITDCNELRNLAEICIFIWGKVPGGDEDIWAIKLSSGRIQIQKWQKLFRF